MGYHDGVMGWGLLGVQAAAGFLSDRNYRSLPRLGPEQSLGGWVTIVIPARNESARLPDLLRSLAELRYPDREIVVVDDGSSDGTADVAAEFGVRVIRVADTEPGWVGKSFACWIGAHATSGDWLLFTDADTVHAPDSLGRAVGAAQRIGTGLLSLLPRQHCCGFWERLLLPYAHALYFVGAARVNRPGGNPLANGQYMLFRRDEYFRIGGHAAVRGSLIEDVAMARHVAGQGVAVALLRAEDAVAVRMYIDLAGLWEGFAKNAVRFVTVSPRTGVPTVVAALSFLSALPAALRGHAPLHRRLALLLVPAVSLLPWERRFGVPLVYAFLFPVSAIVFQVLALDATRRSVRRSATVWRGRRY